MLAQERDWPIVVHGINIEEAQLKVREESDADHAAARYY